MSVLREMPAEVCYGDQHCLLKLTVVAGKGPYLFGRDWLSNLQLDCKAVGSVTLTKVKQDWIFCLKCTTACFKMDLEP